MMMLNDTENMDREIYKKLFTLIKEDAENMKSILLWKSDIDVTQTDLKGKGMTFLHYATTSEICKELLTRGACVNARDFDGLTPLHHAIITKRDFAVVKELINSGADVNASDHYQRTPLIETAQLYCQEMLEYAQELLRFGANPNHQDFQGNSALTIAIYNKDLDLIKELLEYGADINIQSTSPFLRYILFSTPLAAAVNGCCTCAKLLIKITLINKFENDYTKIVNLDCYSGLKNYSKLARYLEDCVCEIVQMRSYKINNTSSLYDFVVNKSKRIKPLYFYNEIGNFANYPIYKDIIKKNIEPCLQRAKSLNKLRGVQLFIGIDTVDCEDVKRKEICVNSDCLCKIADYLDNDDLY